MSFLNVSRRDILKGAGATGLLTCVSPIMVSRALAGDASNIAVFAAPGTPGSLDVEYEINIGTFEANGMLYDSLLEYARIPDPDNPGAEREDVAYYPDLPGGANMVGKLVDGWDVGADGKTVTFFLKKGVKSHWGNELTAEDIVWSWHRRIELAAIGGFFTATVGISGKDDIQAVDTHTVSFKIANPNPMLFKLHRNPYAPVYDSKKLREVSTSEDPWAKKFLQNNAAGFGPYSLISIDRGTKAVFEAREDYHRGKPAIKKVIMLEIPQSANRAQLLMRGDVDYAQYLQPREVAELAKADGVKVESVHSNQMLWMTLNSNVKPFDNKLVRQAMNHAFPQDEIVKTVAHGLGTALTGCMPDYYPGFAGEYWSYGGKNLDKAKQLLVEAGYPDGFSTSLMYNSAEPYQEPMCILYQSALKKIGVDLKLNKQPPASFFKLAGAREEPMHVFFDAPWCPDPGYSMNLYFLSGSFINYSNYSNAKVDELAAKTAATADNDARLEMMREAQKIIMDDAPWVFGLQMNYNFAHRDNLKGFVYYSSNNVRPQDMTKS